MRFTSLVVELIRARPRLVVWVVLLIQAALWLSVALFFYSSPPGNLAVDLAFGREYRVGSDLGPPLAFWLGDMAYRLAGNHMSGVYLLSELCGIATLWALFLLGRAIVGGQHAVLAVLLTMTIWAFSSPSLEFGPYVLARPLWTLLLLHSWQLIGMRRGGAWLVWSVEAGLLLLTIPHAGVLLMLLAVFTLSTADGRKALRSVDPIFALVVAVAVALPYLMWLLRAPAAVPLALPGAGQWQARAQYGAWYLGGLLLGMIAPLLLCLLNTRWFAGRSEKVPVVFRAPVDRLARDYVYFFALAPPLVGALLAGLFGLDHVIGGAAVVSIMSGLALVVAAGDLIALRSQRLLRTVWAAAVALPAAGVALTTLLVPWTGRGEILTSMPRRAIADFFEESFVRRTNEPLRAVAGDSQLAALIALHSGRPHLFMDAQPQRTPWIDMAAFNRRGGVVVWRASDTAGTPPPEIAQRFPGLVPEVPRAFEWLINGRQPLLRIGWAVVRPKAP